MPPGPPHSVSWLYGREVVLAGEPGAPRALQWLLRRKSSLSPRLLGSVYPSLCVVSLLIGGIFHWQGAPLVLAFVALALALAGAALVIYGRHAGDHETLTLVGRSLQVLQCRGHRIERTDFTADWLTVEPAAGQGSLVELSGRGRTVRVGRLLRPELRAAIARELRQALRQLPAETPPATEPN